MGLTAFNRYRRLQDSKNDEKKIVKIPAKNNTSPKDDQKPSRKKAGVKR